MPEESEYSIRIQYKDFITRFDLDDIIYIVDSFLDEREPTELEVFERENPYRSYSRFPPMSYVGIKSVSSGSVILTVAISAAVYNYVSRRFMQGFDSDGISNQIKRAGKISSDKIESKLKIMNDYFEKNFIPEQKDRGGQVKKITISRKLRSRKKKKQSDTPENGGS